MYAVVSQLVVGHGSHDEDADTSALALDGVAAVVGVGLAELFEHSELSWSWTWGRMIAYHMPLAECCNQHMCVGVDDGRMDSFLDTFSYRIG